MRKEINKEMAISKILNLYPNAEQVMFEHGLHCTNCAGAEVENFSDGAKTHGLKDDEIEKIASKINEKFQNYQDNIEKYKISISKFAQEEVLDIMKEENQHEAFLKFDMAENDFGEKNFTIDFKETKDNNEQEIVVDKIKCLVPEKKFDDFVGIELDYIRNEYIDGFKITKPKL